MVRDDNSEMQLRSHKSQVGHQDPQLKVIAPSNCDNISSLSPRFFTVSVLPAPDSPETRMVWLDFVS